MLYGNGYAQTTGAVYRLLQRSGVVRESLALKKACVQQGTVTQDEFDWLRGHLGDVRSFTLIPLVALRTALSVFGCDERSEALVAALGMERPADWPEVQPEEEGERRRRRGGGGRGGTRTRAAMAVRAATRTREAMTVRATATPSTMSGAAMASP